MNEKIKYINGDLPKFFPNDAIIVICVCRNEGKFIPWFLKYYRSLGVDHFFFIDNNSNDNSVEYLSQQSDVSLFSTEESYFKSKNGRQWSSEIANRYARDCWCLTLDLDEILVFPMSEHLKLKHLISWLIKNKADALFTIMIDMYPKNNVEYLPGESFIDASPYFDKGPYWVNARDGYPNISVFGGARQRLFFTDKKNDVPFTRNGGPVIRKIPLVFWKNKTEYLSSTHSINTANLSPLSGALLHFKFIRDFIEFANSEILRGDRNPGEYEAYIKLNKQELSENLFYDGSVEYQGTDQLISLGLIAAPKSYINYMHKIGLTQLGKKERSVIWEKFKTARLEQNKKFQMQLGNYFAFNVK